MCVDRLLWSTGTNTILSTYIVGIYCNRQLIGQGMSAIEQHFNDERFPCCLSTLDWINFCTVEVDGIRQSGCRTRTWWDDVGEDMTQDLDCPR